MAGDAIDEALLLECLASPWSSAFQLAVRVGIEVAAAQAACERLVLAGYLQRVRQGLTHLPPVVYAPMPSALNLIAERWQVAPGAVARAARLSEARFWWLRAALEIAQEVNGLCSTLAGAKPEWRVTWETGIARTYRGAPLIVHGRFAIHVPMPSGGEKAGAFYLLIDRGEQKTLGWWRVLRYLSIASRRDAAHDGATFPVLLIVTTNSFRASSLMRLAHKFNCRASLATSWDRATIFGQGAHAAEWVTLVRDEPSRVRLVDAQPFAPDRLHGVARKHLSLRVVRPRSASVGVWPAPDIGHMPEWANALAAIESLDDAGMRALAFLYRHPLCPRSTLEAFLRLTPKEGEAILQRLHELGLAEPEELLLPVDRDAFGDEPEARARRVQLMREYGRCDPASTERRIADAILHGALARGLPNADGSASTGRAPLVLPVPDIWRATEDVVRLRALREGRHAERYAAAYAAMCRERHARPYHALAVHDFFERLQRDAMRYAAATRKMAGVDADYYELITFEDELLARASFTLDVNRRYWCPDGYGVLRCGRRCTPFWLEIDGTLGTRARTDVAAWRQKLDGLCAYCRSGDWTRRHPAFPALLVVTADAEIKGRLREALEQASNGQGMSAPRVFFAGRGALLQRGPLAPVWADLSQSKATAPLTYAFAGAQQPDLSPGADKLSEAIPMKRARLKRARQPSAAAELARVGGGT